MRLVLAILLLLSVPASASASKVSVVLADGCQGDVACSKYGGAPPVPITTFQAAPGEANRVSVRRDGGDFVVRDDGAALTAEAPCVALDASSARCPLTRGEFGLHGLAALLGDGDDALAIEGDLGVETVLDGGDGDDSIEGGAGNDRVDGGAGDDRLLGGGGFDELSYATRTESVTVDLRAGTAGASGERDRVEGFGTVVGGSDDDVLAGSERADLIDGGAGNDEVRGRGGDDALFGNLGADLLQGMRGDDRLYGDPAQGDDFYTPIVRLRADLLIGGRGDDLLTDTGGRNQYFGGPGADVLEGGANPDKLDAGPGPDRVLAYGGGADRVRCGAGRDRARTDRRDTRRGCERR